MLAEHSIALIFIFTDWAELFLYIQDIFSTEALQIFGSVWKYYHLFARIINKESGQSRSRLCDFTSAVCKVGLFVL